MSLTIQHLRSDKFGSKQIDSFTDVTDNLTKKELSVLKLVLENSFYTTNEMAVKLAVSGSPQPF